MSGDEIDFVSHVLRVNKMFNLLTVLIRSKLCPGSLDPIVLARGFNVHTLMSWMSNLEQCAVIWLHGVLGRSSPKICNNHIATICASIDSGIS